jgi:hypothetical protein
MVSVFSGKLNLLLALQAALVLSARAGLQSGVYQTLPDATAHEQGDRVPNESRVVPLFARLRFDLAAAQPSLTAVITNAVLEGGDPFVLTVRSSSGSASGNNSYTFHGDYLQDLYPLGSQYAFDWHFTAATNGSVVWNGNAYWTGGHIWDLTISGVVLVPVPYLDIARAGNGSIQITWATNFAGHILECAPSLPAVSWGPVTNAVANMEGRLSVTVDVGVEGQFYRLRKP